MPSATVNGTRLYYEVNGEGEPILFLHPPLLTSSNFRYQQQLADEFQLVTVDLRGHGKSAASTVPLSYPVMAEDIRQLLDHLKLKKVYVCGYSTGGGLALEAMLAYPDRFAGAVLVSAMPEAGDAWLKLRLATATTLSKRRWSSRLLARAISWGNADSRTTYRQLLKHSAGGNRANIEQYYRASRRSACTERASAIHQPVLLLYGEKDTGFHKYAWKLHESLPDAELLFVPGAPHQIPTKNAAELNRYMREWINSKI
ncbi:MAG: alpha/beta hydrolase [Paenibacillus sp.]|nr:alpha/beta hydrolase [Paenibacillus sp.]